VFAIAVAAACALDLLPHYLQRLDIHIELFKNPYRPSLQRILKSDAVLSKAHTENPKEMLSADYHPPPARNSLTVNFILNFIPIYVSICHLHRH